jgi:Tfp pilus assembly protein PilF
MRKGEKDRSLTVFQLNVDLRPQSANVHHSLAECYEFVGDRDRAIASYRRSLELNPKNGHAEERLKALAGVY